MGKGFIFLNTWSSNRLLQCHKLSVDELPYCTIAFFAYANCNHIDLSPLSASEMCNMHKNPPSWNRRADLSFCSFILFLLSDAVVGRRDQDPRWEADGAAEASARQTDSLFQRAQEEGGEAVWCDNFGKRPCLFRFFSLKKHTSPLSHLWVGVTWLFTSVFMCSLLPSPRGNRAGPALSCCPTSCLPRWDVSPSPLWRLRSSPHLPHHLIALPPDRVPMG